jgi:hypothetical protein
MGSDWESMAKLIVDAFEAPAENASTIEKARWFIIRKKKFLRERRIDSMLTLQKR